MAARLFLSLAFLAATSCTHPRTEKEKAVESARDAAKAHPVFGGSKMDWQNPHIIEEDDAFRVEFSPAPGWMGGSVTYSVSKSDGQVKVVSAEQ